ncbi:hypothetical protein BTJ68_08233 [Hortaea werneckii EXF-2000]|uniref:Uncharacterized protein n=1 Tax=Hortaea werneckii EXF-2000 TaxID=1157616 RepID=A0A1Z5TC64_HORWE|nr:hypothetical protein BTJ68_08233 [Hortaea werneckii EXF-2000]
MKTRKNFSFDPRLKLVAAPSLPKACAPPLSPIVEAELRASCAYVLQNFRPSHVVYNEHTAPAAPQKAQLDYATIKESVPKDMQRPTHRPISKISARSNEKPPSEPEAGESEAMSPGRFPITGSFTAEQLMGRAPSKAPPPTTRQRSDSHVHTLSSQAKAEPTERPRTAARTESTETTGSTPQTDTTDYPWSDEKSSTGMTSAACDACSRLEADLVSGIAGMGKQQHQQQQHQEKTVPGSKTSSDETDTTPKILTPSPNAEYRQGPATKAGRRLTIGQQTGDGVSTIRVTTERCTERGNDPVTERASERRVKLSVEGR